MKDLKPTQLLRLLAVAVLLSFLAACSDDDDKPTYGTLGSLFYNPTIIGCSSCHNGYRDNGTGTADLSIFNFKASLMDFKAGDDKAWGTAASSGACKDDTLLKPGSKSGSAVLGVIAQSYSKNCGSYNYHAANNAVLEGYFLEEFIFWIESGAY